MAYLGTTEAAQIAGVSKNTIIRAVKAGKLSAHRDETGAYQIDPAEFARLYPDAMARHVTDESEQMARHVTADRCSDDEGTSDDNHRDTARHSAPDSPNTATNGTPNTYRTKAAAWRQVAQLEREKSAALQDTIADLRARLDRAEAERQRTSAQLSGLLTHQVEQGDKNRRRWWPW